MKGRVQWNSVNCQNISVSSGSQTRNLLISADQLLTLLHSERPLHTLLAFLNAIGLTY